MKALNDGLTREPLRPPANAGNPDGGAAELEGQLSLFDGPGVKGKAPWRSQGSPEHEDAHDDG